MHITNINNSQPTTFQGTVDKSVTKYLDKSFKNYKRNVTNARSKNASSKIHNYEELINQTKTVLNDFMKGCHPDTKLKLKETRFLKNAQELVIENSFLPTTPNVNISERISLRFPNNGQPVDAGTLKAVMYSFKKELNPTTQDRNLLRYSINNLEAKANTNWFNKIIANWQLKKAEKFSIEINKNK